MNGARKTSIILILNRSCRLNVTISSLLKGSEGQLPLLSEGLYRVPNYTNGLADLFLFDSQNNTYGLACISISGTQSDGQNYGNLSSGNRKSVLFFSESVDLQLNSSRLPI
jgi:hypothetical protein